ncbi:hypothetical protein Q5H93_06780 [Hymenobacter sp. ASUV-10]|uniref:Uncharacterized protein n=1 Tax=Hymenobacter aranciens TaxID=3063996 RepID=A0ABT9B820_9BACT|nr:hypothetical protein [Hymenobacter sp. ASUV-10]MDO7874432.1 hypothetical protein [Hymenobacter sp. ASUV-10]
MKTRLLLGVLCLLAGPLRAQPQLAQRTDAPTAAPVLVPIPAAVAQACQRYLPETAANPAAVWTAYGSYAATNPTHPPLAFEVTTQLIRTDPRWVDTFILHKVDTLCCTLTAIFDSPGRLRYHEREVAPDTLPLPVRRAMQRVRQHTYANGEIVLVVGIYDPDNRNRSRRIRYKVWLYSPQILDRPGEPCEFWRSGRPIFYKNPVFR